jgi:hypothetical protein
LTDKNVFVGSSFYSLEAEMGGAIYVNNDVSIGNCKFANNTAENHEGNDVYVDFDSIFFNDSGNIQNTCSLSIGPGQLKTSSGVCIFFFILSTLKLNHFLEHI